MKKKTVDVSGWRDLVEEIALPFPEKGYHNANYISKELEINPLLVRRRMRKLRETNRVVAKQYRNPENGKVEWYYKQ